MAVDDPAPRAPRQGPVALADLFAGALKELAPRSSAPATAPSDGFLFSGNRHESVPRRLFLDRRLTPLERNAWQVFRLMLNQDGVTLEVVEASLLDRELHEIRLAAHEFGCLASDRELVGDPLGGPAAKAVMADDPVEAPEEREVDRGVDHGGGAGMGGLAGSRVAAQMRDVADRPHHPAPGMAGLQSFAQSREPVDQRLEATGILAQLRARGHQLQQALHLERVVDARCREGSLGGCRGVDQSAAAPERPRGERESLGRQQRRERSHRIERQLVGQLAGCLEVTGLQ